MKKKTLENDQCSFLLWFAWPGTELCRVPDPSPAPVTGALSGVGVSAGPELELEPG